MVFVNDNNDIKSCISLSYTCFLSSTASRNSGGMRVEYYDFRRVIPMYMAKSIPKNTWVNDCDVYLQPLKER
jgi:hypothetical protein